jgi:hypothetical protein
VKLSLLLIAFMQGKNFMPFLLNFKARQWLWVAGNRIYILLQKRIVFLEQVANPADVNQFYKLEF